MKAKCNRCKQWFDISKCSSHVFTSNDKCMTYIGVMLCMNCRDAVVDFIKGEPESPPTITIPETTLPEPTKTAPGYGGLYFGVICHHTGWCVLNAEWRGRAEDMELLSAGCVHTSDKAAQQWADFFNKYLVRK